MKLKENSKLDKKLRNFTNHLIRTHLRPNEGGQRTRKAKLIRLLIWSDLRKMSDAILGSYLGLIGELFDGKEVQTMMENSCKTVAKWIEKPTMHLYLARFVLWGVSEVIEQRLAPGADPAIAFPDSKK